jgi:hypothetical protein
MDDRRAAPLPERPVPLTIVLAVRALIAAMLFAGALAGCGGGDSESGETQSPEMRMAGDADGSGSDLFVQTAEGGGFTGDGEDVTLTLRSVSAVTTTFTDPPEPWIPSFSGFRRRRSIATAAFVSSFDQSFGEDPPNAIVSSLERGEFFTIELSDPRYEEATRTLTYAVRSIGADGSDLPSRLGPVSVVIDGRP